MEGKKQTAVEWLENQYIKHSGNLLEIKKSFEHAKEMEKENTIDFGQEIIDHLCYGAQSRKWIEEKYNDVFKSE